MPTTANGLYLSLTCHDAHTREVVTRNARDAYDQARRDGATPVTARYVAAEDMQRWLDAHIDAWREESAPTRDQQAGESPRLFAHRTTMHSILLTLLQIAANRVDYSEIAYCLLTTAQRAEIDAQEAASGIWQEADTPPARQPLTVEDWTFAPWQPGDHAWSLSPDRPEGRR